jgi:predicted regulator of Ras-like GTPase activity (Roadblock/LC7/MglB family)
MLQKVDGALAVLIVGVDGITIDRAEHPENEAVGLNFDLLAAEYTSLLKTALRTAEDVDVGLLQEMTVFTEQYQFVVKMITCEYYLMFVLRPDGNFGRARYELKKAKILLEKEFQI